MAAFERMEEKVLQMEARSQAASELAGADLESQFALLEAGNNVDDELEAMKIELLSPATPPAQAQLPSSPTTEPKPEPHKDAVVDAELEALKTKLDQL
jgi:phage shock protein A